MIRDVQQIIEEIADRAAVPPPMEAEPTVAYKKPVTHTMAGKLKNHMAVRTMLLSSGYVLPSLAEQAQIPAKSRDKNYGHVEDTKMNQKTVSQNHTDKTPDTTATAEAVADVMGALNKDTIKGISEEVASGFTKTILGATAAYKVVDVAGFAAKGVIGLGVFTVGCLIFKKMIAANVIIDAASYKDSTGAPSAD